MELQITGINIELASPLRSYIERKMSKLNRHLPNIIEVKAEASEEKTKSPQQRYLLRVNVDGSGAGFHGEARAEDLFKAVDKVTATMIRQLEDYKGKLYERTRGSSPDREGTGGATILSNTPEVVKVKHFTIKLMTVTEAADQMEVLGHDFFLFYNATTEEVNLLYRRKDGNYGLIEPELE